MPFIAIFELAKNIFENVKKMCFLTYENGYFFEYYNSLDDFQSPLEDVSGQVGVVVQSKAG